MIQSMTILGSTGSIGRQALELAEFHGVEIRGLACARRVELLLEQVRSFQPHLIAIADPEAARRYEALRRPTDPQPEVLVGDEGVRALASEPVDLVLGAIVGMASMGPCLEAARAGNQLGLANKEALVCAGDLLLDLTRASGKRILPVDSEHWAIFDCLQNRHEDLAKIFLTASGGPFRGASRDDLRQITVEEALAHPTWSMGAKISIDSATLMNKGLEMIEAAFLFDVDSSRIEVVVHPQSIVHSAVLWQDGSCTAQLSFPDMRGPIQGVMSYPHKIEGPMKPFDFLSGKKKESTLSFESVDESVFGCLRLARQALDEGGAYPLVLNAANEVAVEAFLNREVPFLAIESCVEACLERYAKSCDGVREDEAALLDLDRETRLVAKEFLKDVE